MENAIRTAKSRGSHRNVKLVAVLFLAAVFQGVAADDFYNPVSADFAREIKQQGAAALQEMTRDLQQNMNWSRRGVEELETTLKQQAMTNDQVVNNVVLPECNECIDCHNRNERS